MTARPIGAATDPPVASRPRSPPLSTSTATATCGSFGRGERDVPGVRRGLLRASRRARRCRSWRRSGPRDLPAALGVLLGRDHHAGDRRGRPPTDIARPSRSGCGAVRRWTGRRTGSPSPAAAPSAGRRWRSSRRSSRSAAGSAARRAGRCRTAAGRRVRDVADARRGHLQRDLPRWTHRCRRPAPARAARPRRAGERGRRTRCCRTGPTRPSARRSGRRRTACRRSSPAWCWCPSRVMVGGRGQRAVRGEAALQRGGGVDQLERGARRVGLADRPVGQHRSGSR